jgi:two-component system, NarL family, sensor histidine kinase BarA
VSASTVLDETLPLSDILDLEGFREICKSFSELYGIGIKVFDLAGKKIADVRVSTGDHCGYLFTVHPTQVLCTNLVSHIRSVELEANPTPKQIDCFSGLRYKILPIVYEGSLLGRVIFGPYRPQDVTAPPAALARYTAQGLDVGKLGGFLTEIPKASEQAVDKVLHNIRNVIDVVIHNGYKMHLTSKLHIASVRGAFGDLEKTNKSLKLAYERLQELDRLKSNFIATVSHELRTPLTSVIGYSEMLLEGMAGALNEEQRNYIKTILEKGENLLTLIGQVLDMSRIESGNVTMRMEVADVRETLALCISDVVPQAKKRTIELTSTIDSEVRPINVDLDKVRRIVTNLLGNAVKFTKPGGKVQLIAKVVEDLPVGAQRPDPFDPARNRFLSISVSDTGIGIPEDKLDQIFDAFFQVDNTSTREFGGTGLGLAIVRNFVHAHQGRVSVESELGRGSTFTVKLPYVATRPVESAGVDGLGGSITPPPNRF